MPQSNSLPGYKKKSFLLYYNDGEIWFEHLDSIYGNEDLVIQKLYSDIPLFATQMAVAIKTNFIFIK